MRKIRLAIADDDVKFRKAIIKAILMEIDFEVISEAENGAHLLEQLKLEIPDVILMDMRMPEMNGIEATDRIRELYPHLKIIAYTQYDQEENIVEMNIRGVKSFVGKSEEPEELFKAIRVVHSGGAYMTDKAVEIIQNHLKRYSGHPKCSIELNELDITLLTGICKGYSSTDLAGILNKSPRTVEDYRQALYQKFQVENKEQLIAKAVALKAIKL